MKAKEIQKRVLDGRGRRDMNRCSEGMKEPIDIREWYAYERRKRKKKESEKRKLTIVVREDKVNERDERKNNGEKPIPSEESRGEQSLLRVQMINWVNNKLAHPSAFLSISLHQSSHACRMNLEVYRHQRPPSDVQVYRQLASTFCVSAEERIYYGSGILMKKNMRWVFSLLERKKDLSFSFSPHWEKKYLSLLLSAGGEEDSFTYRAVIHTYVYPYSSVFKASHFCHQKEDGWLSCVFSFLVYAGR